MIQFDIVVLLCVLLMMSYFFDITASKTKIPSILLLILSGLVLQISAKNLGIKVPDLSSVLPILGTIGLILIVLEGSLELELKRSKLAMILNANVIALLSIVITTVIFVYGLNYLGYFDTKINWINVIPLTIISSAIAIPTVRTMSSNIRQFTIYESSLSDIYGVIIFNFLTLNEFLNSNTFMEFFIDIIVMILLSIVATLILAFFLAKTKHHVKFIPIIVFIVLIYTMAKHYHLPSLIFIMIFGLTLNNLSLYRNNKFVEKFAPETLITEIHRFTEITAELAFIVRSIFFILFGFLIEIPKLLNQYELPWTLGVVIVIYLVRALLLLIFKRQVMPYLFIAPRGLITILLFLSIPVSQKIDFINTSMITQVIFICTIIMMLGMMFYKERKEEEQEERRIENDTIPPDTIIVDDIPTDKYS